MQYFQKVICGRAILTLVLLFWFGTTWAQIPTGSSARSIQTDVERSNAQVSQLIARAEDHFRKGKANLDDNKREAARDEFDQAVDTLLESGVDMRASQRLQIFYLELVERVYREEVPKERRPTAKTREEFIKTSRDRKLRLERLLPQHEEDLHEAKARLAQSSSNNREANERVVTSAASRLEQLRWQSRVADNQITYWLFVQDLDKKLDKEVFDNAPQKAANPNRIVAGFREQKFAPAPLDELSRLVLTAEEQPLEHRTVSNRQIVLTKKQEEAVLGSRPRQLANGTVPIVMSWLQENLNDPYSMRIVRWNVEKVFPAGEPYWVVRVRLRAKNGFGAYVLNDYAFYIRRNRILFKI